MKNKILISIVILLSVISVVSADYLDGLRELDTRLMCLMLWLTPAVIILLAVLGGFLLVTGDPANRVRGKDIILTSIIGLFLVLAFIGISVLLLPDIKLSVCW